MKNRRFTFIAILLSALLGGGLVFRWQGDARQAWAQQQDLEKRRASWNGLKTSIEQEIRRFHGESAVWVEDLDTGWTTGYHQGKVFPAASVVKIPILAACYEAAARGQLRLDEPVTLRGADKVYGSGVLKAEPGGSVHTVDQLIELMITRSDNTATNLLIQKMGFGPLNQAFRRMGLAQTHLSRKMMDFSQRRKGVENTTSARDISLTLKKLYRRELVSREVSERCLELLTRVTLKDRIPARLPAGTVVAHKTGLERGVCHDSGIVFTPSGNYLVCVLTRSRNKTAQPAKEFIARIAYHAHRYKTQL